MSVMDLAGSAVNTIGALGTAVYNRQTQNSVNRLNVALAGQQNAWNLAQWMRENSYNDPSAQVKRLREAGLNPALAMTQSGLVDAGNAMPGRPAAEARAVAPPPLDPLTLAQTRLLNAETEKTKSETREGNARTKAQDLANQAEELIQNYPIESYFYTTVNGEDSDVEVSTSYHNLRVERAKLENDMQKLGVKIDGAELNTLIYDWYVLTGAVADENGVLMDPTDAHMQNDWYAITEGESFKASAELLRGSRRLQDVAERMAELDYQAAKAQKAGLEAFEKWVDENKDNPLVQLLLIFRGFLQTTGLSNVLGNLPNVNVRRVNSRTDAIHYHSHRNN